MLRGSLRRLVPAVAAPVVFVAARCLENDDDDKKLKDVKPFVALFLDPPSIEKVREKFGATGRSATYVLLEPTEVTSDVTRPAIFAPLMGEPGTAKFIGRRSGDLETLRAVVHLGETPLEGLDIPPCLSWGASSDDDVADAGARDEKDFVPLPEPHLEVSGMICRGDYFYDGKCNIDPLLECPLCAFMKQSPCKDVFTEWEDCLNACEAQGGTDDERQTRFIESCAAQTLQLKECVDQYPEFFGNMFGGDPLASPATADDDDTGGGDPDPSPPPPSSQVVVAPDGSSEETPR